MFFEGDRIMRTKDTGGSPANHTNSTVAVLLPDASSTAAVHEAAVDILNG
jgi:hypothetical protein